ncbi:MAG: PEGA domain-containing protein [Lachnospiraceae bacterium]|nr:PEGA domain-containing protein [Lachnospiraceae bacterium]
MKKAIVPIFLIAVLTIFGIYLVAKEYSRPGTHNDTPAADENEDLPEESDETAPVGNNSGISVFDAVLAGADYELKTLTLKDPESAKTAELSYDGTTEFFDRFGQSVTAKELSTGEILYVGYSDESGVIKYAGVNEDYFFLSGVEKFSVDEKKHIFNIGDTPYRYADDVFIYSDEGKGEWMDLTDLDTLSVRGKDRDIYSIAVEKGHGYIRIINDSYFVGGWIEVGKEIIRPITEDMLLPAPEGEFHVRLTNRGYVGEEDLTISRNRETVLDLGKIDIEEVAIGHVEFNIVPDFAQLFIDGEITDYEERVPLEYGIHRIKIEAAGYEPVTTNIKIGSDYANVDITLDTDDSETAQAAGTGSRTPVSTGNTKAPAQSQALNVSGTGSGAVSPGSSVTTGNTGSSNNTGILNNVTDILSNTGSSTDVTQYIYDTLINSVVSNNKKIFIQEPKGCDVYLDGNYIGVAPASTNKVTGMHVVTLSRNGYATKSYTVNIENDGNDITFSFSELNPE